MVVSGSTESVGRAELLKRLGEVRAIDRFEADRFIGGQPLRLVTRTDEAAALVLAEKVRGMGGVANVEPSPPQFSMPSDISLMSLDGDGDEPAPVMATDLPAAVAVVAVAAPVAAPRPAAPRPATPADEARFDAPPIAETVMELEQPVAPPKAAPQPSHTPPPEALPPPPEELEQEEPFQPIPGRLMQGQLQRQPGLRLAIGIALGLFIGYALSAPYQSRAERRVAQIRAQANADRFRPVDEARANAARLDEQADDLGTSAFYVTLVIWLGSAGAVVAGWYRFT